jgi:hypothetical protein
VRSEVIEDHDIAWLEGRDKKLLDIGAKALAVDRTLEQAGRVDPIVAESGEERRRLPPSLRDLVDETRSLRRPAAKPRQVGFRPGLVEEDETPGVDEPLIGPPARAMAAYVPAILLARDERLLWNGPPLLPAS